MQRSIDLTLSILASVVSVLLSWPYWRSFSYFAESRAAWASYFVVGFVLAVFVFYVFFRALRTLFTHDIPGAEHHHHHHHHHPAVAAEAGHHGPETPVAEAADGTER